jgi:hypothetical protein
MAHIYISLISRLAKLSRVDLWAIDVFFGSIFMTFIVFNPYLLVFLGMQFLGIQLLESVLLAQLVGHGTSVSRFGSINVTNVVNNSPRDCRSGYFRCVSINFAHLNDMSPALRFHFVSGI